MRAMRPILEEVFEEEIAGRDRGVASSKDVHRERIDRVTVKNRVPNEMRRERNERREPERAERDDERPREPASSIDAVRALSQPRPSPGDDQCDPDRQNEMDGVDLRRKSASCEETEEHEAPRVGRSERGERGNHERRREERLVVIRGPAEAEVVDENAGEEEKRRPPCADSAPHEPLGQCAYTDEGEEQCTVFVVQAQHPSQRDLLERHEIRVRVRDAREMRELARVIGVERNEPAGARIVLRDRNVTPRCVEVDDVGRENGEVDERRADDTERGRHSGDHLRGRASRVRPTVEAKGTGDRTEIARAGEQHRRGQGDAEPRPKEVHCTTGVHGRIECDETERRREREPFERRRRFVTHDATKKQRAEARRASPKEEREAPHFEERPGEPRVDGLNAPDDAQKHVDRGDGDSEGRDASNAAQERAAKGGSKVHARARWVADPWLGQRQDPGVREVDVSDLELLLEECAEMPVRSSDGGARDRCRSA